MIADTSDKQKAHSYISGMMHCEAMARQLGLKDLKRGADSFEIRMWHLGSFGYTQNLAVLNLFDTTAMLSWYQVYRRPHYDDYRWDYYRYPVVDSVVSRTARMRRSDISELRFDSIWNIASQIELDTLKKFGWTDCDFHLMEVADRQRYKYVDYICPQSYYDTIKINDLKWFLHYENTLNHFVYEYGLTPFSR